MILLSDLDFSLPLKNPVVIFSLVLFIILFAPILFNKIRVPHIIGLILAGVVIGPYGLNLLLRDSSIVLFGTVGLLYIMFTAGLEIDLEEFKKNRIKSLVFGLYTFALPMLLGSLAGYYVLGFSWPSAVLLASMFASHTLLAYPIASKYGISRVRAVTLTIGGTIITDILALLVLAAIAGSTKGEIGSAFWIRLAVSSLLFGAIVFLLFPIVARWFFKKFDDSISQYIFVLAMVFLGSFLAEVAGLEAIIGAFLAGLALNRFIPHSSPLMNRIEFVGSAFFIPFFLISVGMLVDFSVLVKGWGALRVAGVMIVLAVLTKFLAAWLTQKTFKLSQPERQMIFGLSTARVGATLAVVLVGYNIILRETEAGEPIRLLSEDVLNGTILMILVTCTISSFTVEKAARAIALSEETPGPADENEPERILISLGYTHNATDLVDLAVMLKPKGSPEPLYALNVIDDEGSGRNASKKIMEQVIKQGAATDNEILPLVRFDLNIGNGIIYSIKEHGITDVIIGLHQHAGSEDNFFGPVVEQVLQRVFKTILVYKPAQPLNTLKRMVVTVPRNAEYEEGFFHWFNRLYLISRETGLPLHIFAGAHTIESIRHHNSRKASPVEIVFQPFTHWDEFLVFTREVKVNDLFIIVSSRRGYLSYSRELEKLPYYLMKYFADNSYIIVYPEQMEPDKPDNFNRQDANVQVF
ncbi:cation:proton antiporter [Paraflavisolibacter sp. H34]|uniref:cation:proton antiporter n=1 Tax=Huijunlia imazamoxiresistens TaxID=3127457 RepID=UPI00301964D3